MPPSRGRLFRSAEKVSAGHLWINGSPNEKKLKEVRDVIADKQQLDAEQAEVETAWLEASEAMEGISGG